MKTGARRYSTVRVDDAIDTIFIPASTEKPSIPDEILVNWQNIVNLATRILDISAGIITRITEQHLTVFISSESSVNILPPGYSVPLDEELLQAAIAIPQNAPSGSDTGETVFLKKNLFDDAGMLSHYGIPIIWQDGELFGTLCVLDKTAGKFPPITEELAINLREIIESDLRYLMLNNDLRKRLSSQDILIREAHHRINNHFTMLISYIQLQLLEGTSREPRDILLDIQNRIRSISVIHEELCSGTSRREVPPLDEYITHLCDCLVSNISRFTIRVKCDVERLQLPVERSVSIGLILAELVTNSIKYAFSENMSPEISVSVHRSASDRITLHYRDNGIGLPPDFEQKRDNTLGMNLITMQIEQFHGELEILDGDGAQFTITIDG